MYLGGWSDGLLSITSHELMSASWGSSGFDSQIEIPHGAQHLICAMRLSTIDVALSTAWFMLGMERFVLFCNMNGHVKRQMCGC